LASAAGATAPAPEASATTPHEAQVEPLDAGPDPELGDGFVERRQHLADFRLLVVEMGGGPSLRTFLTRSTISSRLAGSVVSERSLSV
jgi:hypothetical protein